MSKQLSFVAEEETVDLIEKLKKELGAKTTAEVFRKSLLLAKLAADHARDSDGVVTLRGRKEDQSQATSVMLKG